MGELTEICVLFRGCPEEAERHIPLPSRERMPQTRALLLPAKLRLSTQTMPLVQGEAMLLERLSTNSVNHEINTTKTV